jgi:CheY-like chemotaxis protein
LAAPSKTQGEIVAAKLRILPVEDERIVARDLQSRLNRLGYEVTGLASSKTEALNLTESHKPDLVLMDIRLNGVPEGIEAAEESASASIFPSYS